MDLHANYIADKQVLTTLGGHFQQLYYIIASIFERYGDDLEAFYSRRKANPSDDLSKKATTLRELMIEQFFLPFLIHYLKDVKCEAFSIMATPELASCL